jgi:hypothetical protein
MRAATRCQYSVAKPLTAVATLHSAMPAAIAGRLPRSISREIGRRSTVRGHGFVALRSSGSTPRIWRSENGCSPSAERRQHAKCRKAMAYIN